MTTEDQQEYAEAHRGLGSTRGDARKARTLAHSVTDSFTPEQRAAIEADVLRRVADEWQMGGWTVLTEPIKNNTGPAQIFGAARAVTDWLRARTDQTKTEETP